MSGQPVETTKFEDNSGERRAQRRFARADVAISVLYTIEGRTDAIVGTINNIGGGGARIASRDDLERGSLLTLRFALPKSDRQVMIRGKVVLSFYDAASERFTHGIAFTQIDPVDQESIVAYVESIQHSSPDL